MISPPLLETLKSDFLRLSTQSIFALLAEQPDRAIRYRFEAPHWQVDLSKHAIDDLAWQHLWSFVQNMDLPARIAALCEGDVVNWTEKRAAHHTALRNPDAPPSVQRVRDRLQATAEKWAKKPFFKHVLHLGIGGSILGAQFLNEALARYRLPNAPSYSPLSSLDPEAFREATTLLSPQDTLVILASKSLTTQETQVNFERARAWFASHGINATAFYEKHVHVISAALSDGLPWPVPMANQFPIWDFVGGRYSWCSAMGLPVLLRVGHAHWQALLSGAADMDAHFRSAPLHQNLPVILALVDFWYRAIGEKSAHAIVPYAHALRHFPHYIQQLEMESLGKQMTLEGEPSALPTASIVWGGVGTESQHAFFQFLQQGSTYCPIDFLMTGEEPLLAAHALAQAHALMAGSDHTDPHHALPGGRPSTLLSTPQLTPHALGALLALYEHKTYIASLLTGVNAFDQFGVEAGKAISQHILQAITAPDGDADDTRRDRPVFDPSTEAHIEWLRALERDETLQQAVPHEKIATP